MSINPLHSEGDVPEEDTEGDLDETGVGGMFAINNDITDKGRQTIVQHVAHHTENEINDSLPPTENDEITEQPQETINDDLPV